MTETNSDALFARATQVIPGGVNSPVRAFNAVGGAPPYMKHGAGSRMFTEDGQELIDFCTSWGPLILGHAHPEVVAAVQETAASGLSFGANTAREVELAELLCRLVPSMDCVRLCNSGTEATMTALRLARGVTGRAKILKFDGCYHGHSDSLLVAAGSGLLTGGIASSAGVSEGTAADTHILPYNDLDAVDQVVEEHGEDIAAIIVEPIAGNMGCVPPLPGFLAGLRAAADRCGALLIFDEVITGFRLKAGAFGDTIGVHPDLTCMGKIVGGGLPIGAVGGRKEVMHALAPLGDVYQAGTLSGNPIAVAAGLATLTVLERDQPYEGIAAHATRIANSINDLAATHGPLSCQSYGSMFTIFFGTGPVRNLADAKGCDTDRFAAFFRHMLAAGIYLPPSQFELAFVSAAHSDSDIDAFLSAVENSLNQMNGG